jgi:4-amino-4-deoxy-L-arabinose transferase-like glycosyltransferase
MTPENPHTPPLTPAAEPPHSFLACLPWLWSRVLFPGPTPAPGQLRGASLAWLLFLPAIVLYPCTGFFLFEPDEGRYAQIPFEMLMRGEWIVPYLQGEPYLDKPPLLYWLIMISYSVFGVHDWSARLVPALSVHGCILLVYLFGCRRVGERLAFWGALTLALTPGFLGMARLLVLDGLLTFLVTLALFSLFAAIHENGVRSLFWKWWLLAAAACGLGILCKGPVILILTIPPLILHCWLTRTAPRLTWRALIAFAAVMLAIALPWYVAIGLRLPEFGYYFFWQHNILRYLQPFDHIQPVWYYVPILLPCLLPASLLLIPFVRYLNNSDPATARQRTPELGFALLAGGWCVLFFSLSGCKLPTYILPAFPPLALALGMYAAQSRWQHSPCLRSSAALAYAVMVFGHFVLVPWYAEFRSPMKHAAEVRQLCHDKTVPVVCYPRNVDSVAFYLGRDDLHSFRSKHTPQLVQHLLHQPRTVVLFGHRNSQESLRLQLPPQLHMTHTAPMGLCSLGIVERK